MKSGHRTFAARGLLVTQIWPRPLTISRLHIAYCAANRLSCYYRLEFPLMANERNGHRTALVLFAVAVILAVLAASVTTLERVGTRTVNNETPPGTTGLAKPHPPLDRAPGQPVNRPTN